MKSELPRTTLQEGPLSTLQAGVSSVRVGGPRVGPVLLLALPLG